MLSVDCGCLLKVVEEITGNLWLGSHYEMAWTCNLGFSHRFYTRVHNLRANFGHRFSAAEWKLKVITLVLLTGDNYFNVSWWLDRGCTSKQGWQPRGVFLDSGLHQADDVFMRLHISVNGFGSHEGLASSKPGQHGEISFIFEMICDDDCVFKFQEVCLLREIILL